MRVPVDFTGPRLSLVPLGLENLLFQAYFGSKCQVRMTPRWKCLFLFPSSFSPSLPLHTDTVGG